MYIFWPHACKTMRISRAWVCVCVFLTYSMKFHVYVCVYLYAFSSTSVLLGPPACLRPIGPYRFARRGSLTSAAARERFFGPFSFPRPPVPVFTRRRDGGRRSYSPLFRPPFFFLPFFPPPFPYPTPPPPPLAVCRS